MFYQFMEGEAQRLREQITCMEQELVTLPEGVFYSVKNGTGTKWYYRKNGVRYYIPKRDRAVAEQYVRRKYLTEELKQCKRKLGAIEIFLAMYPESYNTNSILCNEDYQELLTPYFTSQNDNLIAWAQAPYEKHPYLPERCTYMACGNLWVRSKSESMIASFLYQHQIPFRYECALKLGNKTIYPDFTLRHPNSGAYYYIEHFGLFDNEQYRRNALSRIDDYAANGIFLNQRLLVTTETKEKPFSIHELISQLQAALFL